MKLQDLASPAYMPDKPSNNNLQPQVMRGVQYVT
jgi:hypothetical protein